MSSDRPRGWLATPPGRGAIAIVEVVAEDPTQIDELVEALTGRGTIAPGRTAHRTFSNIDDGVVARIGDGHVQFMPHGGPGIVRRLASRLQALSVVWCDRPPHTGFPETVDPVERSMLETLARAASPAAIEPLLAQPSRWRNRRGPLEAEEIAVGLRLQRLIEPPTVACIGPPNAGKSAILNALVRDHRAIVSEAAGTTRDRIGVRLDLDGLVVDWIDTPGFRETADPVERAAIASTRRALDEATLLVEVDAPDVDPIVGGHGGAPSAGVVRVWNKLDLAPSADDERIQICAATGEGIVDLARIVRRRLVDDADLASTGRWRFHPDLEPRPVG